MANRVETLLFRENLARADHPVYVGELLVRQRLVNEAVVGFSEEFLGEGALIVDACAGPEGSILPAALRGYRWIGNDLSLGFARHLKGSGAENVITSDFCNSPLPAGSVEAVLFIFALNNVLKPRLAVQSASRLVDRGGTVVVSDPGLTMWEAKIILHSLLAQQPSFSRVLRGKVFEKDIPGYFARKEYSQADYVDFVIQEKLGGSPELLRRNAVRLVEEGSCGRKHLRKVTHRFHEILLGEHFRAICDAAFQSGLGLAKSGMMVVAQGEGGEWEVHEPLRLQPRNWLAGFKDERANLGEALPQLPETSLHAKRILTCPILCFQKASSTGEQGYFLR